jgi:hypothetical protein
MSSASIVTRGRSTIFAIARDELVTLSIRS